MNTVLIVLKSVQICRRLDETYHSYKPYTEFRRPHIIQISLAEEIIIADWMGQGIGFTNTPSMMNGHHTEEEMVNVNVCTVIKTHGTSNYKDQMENTR